MIRAGLVARSTSASSEGPASHEVLASRRARARSHRVSVRQPFGTAPASAPTPPPQPPAPPPPKAAIGDFGLDLTAAKPEVKAGDDFFAHANGKWYDTFVIPEDRASYGIFTTLDELSQQRVREIIEQAAASQPGARLARAEDRRLLRELHG